MFDAFEHYIIVFDFVKHVEAINCFVDFLHEEKEPLAPIIESACRTVLLYQETLSYIHVRSEEENVSELC